MKTNKKFDFIIFDLDGVLFDTKRNMLMSWNKTRKKYSIKKTFKFYFKELGLPFDKILENLGVQPRPQIFKTYKEESIKLNNLIEPYRYVLKILKFLKLNNIKFSIVTSKDFKRSSFLLKKFKIKPNSLHCPNKKLRGKPYPDHILHAIEKNSAKLDSTCFVGDTYIDYLAAKNAKINFIFAKYGYGINKKEYSNKINSIRGIKNFIKKK